MSAADAMPSSTADQPITQSVELLNLSKHGSRAHLLAEGEIGPHPEIVKVKVPHTGLRHEMIPEYSPGVTSGVFTVTVGSKPFQTLPDPCRPITDSS